MLSHTALVPRYSFFYLLWAGFVKTETKRTSSKKSLSHGLKSHHEVKWFLLSSLFPRTPQTLLSCPWCQWAQLVMWFTCSLTPPSTHLQHSAELTGWGWKMKHTLWQPRIFDFIIVSKFRYEQVKSPHLETRTLTQRVLFQSAVKVDCGTRYVFMSAYTPLCSDFNTQALGVLCWMVTTVLKWVPPLNRSTQTVRSFPPTK